MGAALAFYTLLSSAPLLVFIVIAVSVFFGRGEVENRVVQCAERAVSSTAASLVHSFLESAQRPHHGTLAATIAVITLLFGASGAFTELRDDLNKMWDACPRRRGIPGIILQRVFAFLLVMAAGVLVFALMTVSTALALVTRNWSQSFPIPPPVLEIANLVVSFVLLTIVFFLIYRFVPDLVLPWKVLWTGAAVSAILAVIGKALLGWYLGRAGVGSAYGAAGSLIAIAFWFYYSAQIFLLGAEFTYVCSGRSLRPPETARRAA